MKGKTLHSLTRTMLCGTIYKITDKGKTTFDSKMMNSLEKQWLLRDVNRITHEFKSSRGASVIGALIHITWPLISKGSKKE